MADPFTWAAIGLTAASTAVSAAGTIAGGDAALAAGQSTQQAYEYRAKQEEQAAQESRASAQRVALDKQRQGRLLLSTLQARAAAGGGGAADPTILNLGGDIAGRSEYDALLEMYKGENRARGLEDSATASRMSGDAALAEGEAKRKASQLSAIGTIIGGAGSMFGTYSKIGSSSASGGFSPYKLPGGGPLVINQYG